jgi:hypothetical protein
LKARWNFGQHIGMAVQKSAAKKKPAAKKKSAAKKAAAAKKKPAAKRVAAKKQKFGIRSIKAIVDELQASRPGEKLEIPSEHEHYDTIGTWSFDPVGTWASRPPFSVIYQQRNPLGHSKQILSDANKLLDYANFGGAIGTWNAKGPADWLNSPGEWIIVDAELVQEQAEGQDDYFDDEDGEGGFGGNYVDVVIALWKVEEGWAAAVWRPSDRDLLAKLMGLPAWPSKGWKKCEVWYGE